ncbi:MAG: hypothetical protein K2Y21_03250 [Phycisphaerales bacterium]|nr:hypothetical protein [Phycisphaerales bacterium]
MKNSGRATDASERIGSSSRTGSPGKSVDRPQRSTAPDPASASDNEVFAARLWVPRPKPPEVVVVKEPPPPPPPPFKLQLIGIERSESGARAVMVFDPETIKVARVERGATTGRYILEQVAADEAVFVDHRFPGRPRHVLKLRKASAPVTPLRIVDGAGQMGGKP